MKGAVKNEINDRYRHAYDFARTQNLLGPDENFSDVFGRVGRVLILEREDDKSKALELYRGYVDAILQGSIALGTPILINAGREGREDKPLTSCIAPPRGGLKGVFKADVASSLYDTEMGMAVNLDDFDPTSDPKEIIEWLDEQARAAEGRGRKRACSMVTMSVNHPRIFDFIIAKRGMDPLKSKSNISVMMDDRFMEAVKADGLYTLDLKGGTAEVRAKDLFLKIVEEAHANGDPGIIFQDRLKEDDPTPHLSDTIALAPCAELSLTPGEACQFSYVNLGNMTRLEDGRNIVIDWEKLKSMVELLVQLLDNAITYNISRYPHKDSREINSKKRKIGVGVLGLADLFIDLKIPYNSPQAIKLTHDVMSFINYHSKRASVSLAQERGRFPAFDLSRYVHDDDFMRRILSEGYTGVISDDQWSELAADLQRFGLRNAATFAAPPTGRSAQLIEGATQSIEPLWSCLMPTSGEGPNVMTVDLGGSQRKVKLNPRLAQSLDVLDAQLVSQLRGRILDSRGSIGKLVDLPKQVRDLFVTSTELTPDDHIAIVAAVQRHIDEAVAKTINLKSDSKEDDIAKIYQKAWEERLKGITVFRDGCVGEENQIKVVGS